MAKITNIRPANETQTRERSSFDRRAVLKGAAGGAALAGAGLAANGAAGQATPSASPSASPAASPSASPLASLDPAGFYPSGVEGVPDAYLEAPEPYQSYDGVPGNGGTVRVFTIAYQPPPPPRDENQYWQELERRLGVTWEPIITPQPDYGARSATLIASGDIPELYYLNPGQNAEQQYQAMSQGAFLDLTPYLTGSALQQFRNLATFPSYMWENVRFQGKIFGVPKPSSRSGNVPFHRGDWADAVGLATPTSAEEARELMNAFSSGDPNGNGQQDTWGQGNYQGGWESLDNQFVYRMFKTPNGWRLNDDGTLTHLIETEEYRQGLEFVRQLYADGTFHPDAAGMTFADAQNNFISGTTGLHCEGFGSFFGTGSVTFRAQEINPDARTVGFVPPSADGEGPGHVNNNIGYFGFTGIPSALGGDEERVLELLRILDYLAAPFGSEEQIFLSLGIEGVHHTINENGARVITEQGRTERGDLVYIMGSLNYFYYPENPELALQVQELALQAAAAGVDNPTWVLYSETEVSEGPTLDQFASDSARSIILGREPLESFDSIVQEFLSRGGEQIRQEFQESLQQQ